VGEQRTQALCLGQVSAGATLIVPVQAQSSGHGEREHAGDVRFGVASTGDGESALDEVVGSAPVLAPDREDGQVGQRGRGEGCPRRLVGELDRVGEPRLGTL
jgi:hypothetical protein